MKFVGKALGVVGSVLGIGGKKRAAAPAPAPAPTPAPVVEKVEILPLPVARRDDAADAVARDDELRRRRGSAADILTGSRGAEAGGSSVGKLVIGN